MCKNCREGGFVTELRAKIAKWGFTMVSVGSLERRGWVYTVGLLDLRDHPELVVAGWPLRGAAQVLEKMGEAVVEGQRYDGGESTFSLCDADLGVVHVNREHLARGLMNAWQWYYDGIGRSDLELRAMQAVLPDADHCFEHQTLQPRLDNARHVAFDGMNRAERRGHRGSGHVAVPRHQDRGPDARWVHTSRRDQSPDV